MLRRLAAANPSSGIRTSRWALSPPLVGPSNRGRRTARTIPLVLKPLGSGIGGKHPTNLQCAANRTIDLPLPLPSSRACSVKGSRRRLCAIVSAHSCFAAPRRLTGKCQERVSALSRDGPAIAPQDAQAGRYGFRAGSAGETGMKLQVPTIIDTFSRFSPATELQFRMPAPCFLKTPNTILSAVSIGSCIPGATSLAPRTSCVEKKRTNGRAAVKKHQRLAAFHLT